MEKEELQKRLKSLRKEAPDLRKEGFLCRQRFDDYQMEAASWRLFYACERIDQKGIDALWSFASDSCVLEKMRSLQRGEGESLHCILRTTSETNLCSKAIASKRAQEKEIENLAAFLDQKKQSKLLIVGMGASTTAPQALYHALERKKDSQKEILFLSSMEPDALLALNLNFSDTLVAIVTKSGSTEETLLNAKVLRALFIKEGIDPQDSWIFLSQDPPQEKYAKHFVLERKMGGRYGIHSVLGALVFIFSQGAVDGIDSFFSFCRGSGEMDANALEERKNLPLLLALLGIWNRNVLDHSSSCMLPYIKALSSFFLHVQQCEMESNGKQAFLKTSPLIWGGIGPQAEHSFFQALHQGSDCLPLELIACVQPQALTDSSEQNVGQRKTLAHCLGQMLALASGSDEHHCPGNRPSRLLICSKLTAHSLGALWALYEHKIVYQAFLWGINPFDQPAVELGKSLSRKLYRAIDNRKKYSQTLEGILIDSLLSVERDV